jgi:hypothetical protein
MPDAQHWRRPLLTTAAVYYIATGLWPILHIASFEAVTGPKIDDWLVHMVGLLVIVIGLTLLAAVRQKTEHSAVIATLVIGAACAFTATDTWYVLAGVIRPIYLADAVVEVFLVGGMVITRRTQGDE